MWDEEGGYRLRRGVPELENDMSTRVARSFQFEKYSRARWIHRATHSFVAQDLTQIRKVKKIVRIS